MKKLNSLIDCMLFTGRNILTPEALTDEVPVGDWVAQPV
jgi:hypothetical protein